MLINVADVALRLRERFRLSSLPNALLAEEIVPVVIVDELTSGATGISEGVGALGHVNAGAVVGQYSYCDFWMSTAGNIAVVDRLWLSSEMQPVVWGLALVAGYTAASISPIGTKIFLDGRLGRPSAQIQGFNSVASPGTGIPVGGIMRHNDAFRTRVWELPVPIRLGLALPYQGIRLYTTTTNVQMTLQVAWREFAR